MKRAFGGGGLRKPLEEWKDEDIDGMEPSAAKLGTKRYVMACKAIAGERRIVALRYAFCAITIRQSAADERRIVFREKGLT